jgi:hypothetical protein
VRVAREAAAVAVLAEASEAGHYHWPISGFARDGHVVTTYVTTTYVITNYVTMTTLARAFTETD